MNKKFFVFVLISICALSCINRRNGDDLIHSESKTKEQVEMDKVMHEKIESANKNLPLKIDEVTTAQCVTFIGHTISYKFVVADEAIDNVDTTVFKSNVLKNLGNAQINKAVKYYINNNIFIVYDIFDSNNVLHYCVKITPSDLKTL
jgi:hypothetical protein